MTVGFEHNNLVRLFTCWPRRRTNALGHWPPFSFHLPVESERRKTIRLFGIAERRRGRRRRTKRNRITVGERKRGKRERERGEKEKGEKDAFTAVSVRRSLYTRAGRNTVASTSLTTAECNGYHSHKSFLFVKVLDEPRSARDASSLSSLPLSFLDKRRAANYSRPAKTTKVP